MPRPNWRHRYAREGDAADEMENSSHRYSDSVRPVCFQAYTAYLTGMVEFELQEWKRAMEAFNKCKSV